MLFFDILHGAAGEKTPPDAKDSKQYVGVYVGVDRATKKPSLLTFHVPPDADEKQGFFVAFASDKQVNGQWHVELDKESTLNLGFDRCDTDSCVARLREGKVDNGKGGLIELMPKFDQADHLLLLYTRKGQPIRTMIPLHPYRTAFVKALSEMEKQ